MTSIPDDKPEVHQRFAAAVDSPSRVAVRAAERIGIPADLLDGGEIVLLAIKPSLWFVLFDAAKWILAGALLLIIGSESVIRVPGLSSKLIVQLAFLMMTARCGAALLRWVSRFYVLTNRRVMRVWGVFKADIYSCPLVNIRNTRISVSPHERVTRLGTVRFVSKEPPSSDLLWHHIARVDEVHDRVRRAIERAIDNQPHV